MNGFSPPPGTCIVSSGTVQKGDWFYMPMGAWAQCPPIAMGTDIGTCMALIARPCDTGSPDGVTAQMQAMEKLVDDIFGPMTCPDCGEPLKDVKGYLGCLCLWGGRYPTPAMIEEYAI